VPAPEDLPSEAELKERVLPMMPEAVRRYYERERPIELRPVEFERYLGKKFEDARFNVWIRATEKLPDEAAYLLARAVHRAEAPFAARLEQARETTIANTVAAAPRPDLIHPGVQKYLREAGIAPRP